MPSGERAPAKVNLTLRILGRRPDGYHELESLVVFAGVGDRLAFTPGPALTLVVSGPGAPATGAVTDNLVLKAARAFAERVQSLLVGRFTLFKHLPVAAGLGGGSADAAAALRVLARANGIAVDDPRLMETARASGADVPVCLASRSRVMRGIGDILSPPLDVRPLPAVLVNPGVPMASRDVFAALRHDLEANEGSAGNQDHSVFERLPSLGHLGRQEFAAMLADLGNDLQQPAVGLQPVIADVVAALTRLSGCRLARMSGSGATCFGLFDSRRRAAVAARELRTAHPDWWVRATMLG